jgi:hypothetical protein
MTNHEQQRRRFLPPPGTFELHERRGDFYAVVDGLTGKPLRVEPIDPEMRPPLNPPPAKSA